MSATADNAEIQRLRTALDEALAERAQVWDELQRSTADQRELDHLHRQIATIRGSVSWRLTAPLRTVKVIALKLRPRLAPLVEEILTMLRRGR